MLWQVWSLTEFDEFMKKLQGDALVIFQEKTKALGAVSSLINDWMETLL